MDYNAYLFPWVLYCCLRHAAHSHCLSPCSSRDLWTGSRVLSRCGFWVASRPLNTFGQHVQAGHTKIFEALEKDDILYIYPSHVATFGPDVNHLLLEIIPSLSKDIWVHVQKFVFPTDYAKDWVIDRWIAFREQYLPKVLLIDNLRLTPEFASHWVSRGDFMPGFDYSGKPESNFWFRVV